MKDNMKKVISSLMLCAVAFALVLTLVSCGGPSGTYEGTFFDLKFHGNKVTVIVGDEELTGTYDIDEDDGKKTIEFDFIDEDEASDEEKYILGIIDSILGAELPFSDDGDTITIGFSTFEKK